MSRNATRGEVRGMQPQLSLPGVRFSGLLVARRHVDLLRVNSALCS